MRAPHLLRFPSRPDWYVARLPRQAGGGFIVAAGGLRLIFPRVALIAIALVLLAALAWADTTPVTTGPLADKALKRRVATSSRVVTVPDPKPTCLWSPRNHEPCACWYYNSNLDRLAWEWRPCLPQEPAVVLEPVFVPEPVEPEPAQVVILPAPSPEPEPGMHLRLEAWQLAGFSGEADRKVTTGGRLSIDGPVAHAFSTPVRMFLRLDLAALPGQTLNLTSVESFGRSAELRGGLYVRLAESFPEDQRITTSLVAWGGFATVTDDQVLDRYLRSGGIGIRLAEEVSGAEITVSWARDEAAGWIGPVGQVAISGSVPIVGTKGALVLGGSAVLNLSRATVSPQRDIFRLHVGASIGDLVSAVRGR